MNNVMTGFCDSLNFANCSDGIGGAAIFDSAAKCCPLEGFLLDEAACQLKGLSAGEAFECSELSTTYNTFVGKTCSSTFISACPDENGGPDTADLNVSSLNLFLGD